MFAHRHFCKFQFSITHISELRRNTKATLLFQIINKFEVSKRQTINKSTFQVSTFLNSKNIHFVFRSSNKSIFNISTIQNSTFGDRASFLDESSSRRTFFSERRNSSGARACRWRAWLYIVCHRRFFPSKYSPLRTPFSMKWHKIGNCFSKIPIHTLFVASACLNSSNRTHVS